MEAVTNPCAVAFWKGGLVIGSVLLMVAFLCLSVGVLLAREWSGQEKRREF